jgi:hypothetical protein
MDTDAKLAALRSAGQKALQIQDVLLKAWRNLNEDEQARASTPEDVELFRQLILRRIYPINAFAALAKVSPELARDMLLSRYVGKGVNPDCKFGGFSFELSNMLNDFRLAGGEQALRDLICHPHFNRENLKDPRVLEAFTEALDMEPEDILRWLEDE